jgi:TPR repeat protein
VLRDGITIEISAILERSAIDILLVKLAEESFKKKDYVRTREILERLASKGNARAMGMISAAIFHGYQGFRGFSEEVAFEYAKKSATLGDTHGESMLAVAYTLGKGTSANPAKAIELLTRYSEKGVKSADGMLALRYLYGTGVAKDAAKAMVYAQRGAFGGDHNSTTVLGIIYALGQGVKRSKEEALSWYSRSLEILKAWKADEASKEAVNSLIGML